MKKYDIVAMGEILIDYTPLSNSENGMQVFEQNAGGAPANVLAAASKLGGVTAFIGKVGEDLQGEFLRQTLKLTGIDTQGLVVDSDYFTTLAFVSLSENGERSFSFARKHSADIMLRKEEIDLELLEKAKMFHFGSLSLTHPEIREATLYALRKAKLYGSIISYDPNYRALLWDDEKTAIKMMRSVLPFVDILKLSEEEIYLMTGKNELNEAADYLLLQGIAIVIITLGAKGAFVATKEGAILVDGYPVKKVVDTTGAGDSFWGAMLQQIATQETEITQTTLKKLKEFVAFANATASLCVQKRGAIAAMPTKNEVLFVIK